MSKAHDPHWRYVAFRLDDAARPLTRRAIGNALKGRFRKLGWPDDELPQLTRFEHPHGIVKVYHHRLQDCRDGLPKMDWAVEAAAKVSFTTVTLSSSGTIKALTDRLGVLQERGAVGPGAKGAKGAPGPKPRPVPGHEAGPAAAPGRRTRTPRPGGVAPPGARGRTRPGGLKD